MEYSPSDILYKLGMHETMCFHAGSNNNNRWYMDDDKLMFRFGSNLIEGGRVRYHYA